MIPAFVAILTFALSAPIAVHAEDQILADEPVLGAEDPIPSLAPVAAPSGEETSGYRSVEASRATITVSLPNDSVRANSDDRIANALFGDEASDDGSVETTRTQRRTER
jgi:hypothetical protein